MSDLPLEAQGHWWLPESPNRKVPGTLTFSSEAGGELTLIGALRTMLEEGERTTKDGTVTISMTDAAMEASGQYGRILGEASNDNYTLDDCFRVRSTNGLFSGQALETIHVNRVLKGALFEPDEPLEATGVTFGTQHLADWIMETGISEQVAWREDNLPLTEEPRFRLEARDLPERHLVSSRGYTVRLQHQLRMHGDARQERCLSQYFFWRIDFPDELSMDSLVDLASDLQDLVSVATNRPAAFEFMDFWHPDVARERPDGTRRGMPIHLYARWNVQSPAKRRQLHPDDLLFSFDGFDGMAGVGRWIDAADKHRKSLGRVMASWYAETTFVSDRLLNCTAALEAFDREHTGSRKRETLETRLKRCASLAGAPFTDLVGNVNAWVKAVIIKRDDVAHNLGLAARTDNTEAYYLWQSLHWLFIMCMLRECNAPASVFDNAQNYGHVRWLRTRIQRLF